MNPEQLTPEQILDKHLHCEAGTDEIISAMEEYAAQQVEQQTKQLKELNETLVSANTEANMKIDHLKEERDRAIGLIMRCNNVYLPEVLQDEIQDFLNQLNQNNEK